MQKDLEIISSGTTFEEFLMEYAVFREAILQKIPEFYEFFFSQTGEGGSIGFHISYSEMVITAKLVGKSE